MTARPGLLAEPSGGPGIFCAKMRGSPCGEEGESSRYLSGLQERLFYATIFVKVNNFAFGKKGFIDTNTKGENGYEQ